MVYTRNQPVATDDLDISQPFVVNNTNAADDSFGIEHYKFSDLTANNGLHNTVTQPLIVGGVHPTTTTNPIIYAMQDTANLGVLQYSRGPSNAVPTPVTELQSQAASLSILATTTSNVFDFTGITKAALCTLYVSFQAGSSYNNMESLIYWFWDGAAGHFKISNPVQSILLSATNSGNILQLLASSSNLTEVRWSLRFHRIQLT